MEELLPRQEESTDTVVALFLSSLGVLSIPLSSFPEHYTHAHKCTTTTIYKAKESRECQGITGGKQTNGHAGLSGYLGM